MWRLLPLVLLVSCASNDQKTTVIEDDTSSASRIVNTIDLPLGPATVKSGESDVRMFSGIETSGAILENGNWSMSTGVSHNRLRCATYETGIQVGRGKSGCEGVQWLGNADFGSNHNHCNSAVRIHTANGKLAELGNAFGNITCVRVVTRCTGPC
jgi:hypothetical protein